MTWITRGVPQTLLRQVEDEMEGSHRAAAIVGASFVEDHLVDVLKSKMVKDENLTRRLFSPGGSHGDFAAKIDLGYLIGAYSREAYEELIIIRRVRNKFAHELELNNFERDDIRDYCNHLVLSQSKIVKAIRGEDGHSIALTLGEWEKERDEEIPFSDFSFKTSPPSSRDRFATACKFYIAAFAILASHKGDKQEPLF